MRLFGKQNHAITENTDQGSFKNTLHIVESTMDLEKSVTAQVAILDFAIDAIGRELEAETTARILHLRGELPDEYFKIPFDFPFEVTKRVNLKEYNVITRPWRIQKLAGAISSVFLYGFRQEMNLYDGTLYPELKLAIIGNGRHHTTAARMKGTASADLTVISLQPVFDQLSTDGAYWYFPNRAKSRVDEYRIAVLYELARKKYDLCQGASFPEPPHEALTDEQKQNPIPQNLLDVLRESNDEKYCLRHENEILINQVKRLESEVAQLKGHSTK